MIARSLPHSLEAEEYLLSCCVLDGQDVIPRCTVAGLTSESFYDPKHGLIYGVLEELNAAGRSTAAETLAEELKTRLQIDSVGGYQFIAQVSQKVPTTAQSSYFIQKVRELSLLRQIIHAATAAVENCHNFTGGIEEFVDQVEREMFAVTQNRVTDRLQSSAAVSLDAMRVMTGMILRKGEMTGVRSGFRDLDTLTWGFQPSDIVILAARPSLGKTALALNIAEHVLLPGRGDAKPVLFFSLEMTASQLMQRMISARARVNMKLLRDGMLSRNGEEQGRMLQAADELARAPFHIDDTSSATLSYIRSRARRVHAKRPLGLVIVDYLQLMGAAKGDLPREQQVAETSRGLKGLAKELNVPIIVISQLNRMSDKEKRAPRLSDLRESGSIEQDADVVLLLARNGEDDQRFQVATDSADLIVAKQRNGPVGDLRLTFLRDITRFENFHQ